MRRKIAKAAALAGLALTLCCAVAACGTTSASQVSGGGSGGDTVTGHLYYANGQPIADQYITFFDIDCTQCDFQPHVLTGTDGSYSIILNDGSYQAQCDYIGGCGVQSSSSGHGQIVTVPPGGTVNFVACQPNSGLAYPECLQG
jgi:hypothetical protein